jgi:hypothetical protein
MKTTRRLNIYVPIAALILTALAIPAAAQQQVPFKGTFQGYDTVALPTITTTATGIGTLVGQLSLTDVLILTSACCGTGTGHWVAANGDSIDSTFVASRDLSTRSLGYVTFTETHTITGGTGRFTGAQGSFTVELFHKLEPSRVIGGVETHDIFGSFHGTITSPGAAH